MADIKDGWVVIPSPVFFDERTAADAFASTFGGEVARAKRHCETHAPVERDSRTAVTTDPIGELTEDDFAC